MTTLGTCAGLIAPYYNLALVIVAVFLFIRLFKVKKPKSYLLPWKYLFAALILFIIEEIITVLNSLNIISFPHVTFAFFELGMITLFIYMLLLQKQHLKK
jgi:hypothetical protein